MDPPQLWTKELDLRFANIFRLVHGDQVSHSRGSNEGTTFHWEEVLKHLVQDNKKENWPESLSSVETLKKRWKLFRNWYAKAYSKPDVQYENDIDIPKLIRRLEERNYEEEGRRGRKKGSLWKRKKSVGEESLDDVTGNGNDSTIEGVELLAKVSSLKPTPSPTSPIMQYKKKSRTESTTTTNAVLTFDTRLNSWISVLRNPVVQKNFRIHTQSDINLEPEVLLNLIWHPFASLLQLAQSLAPLEWVSRIVDPSDHKAIQEHVTEKKDFIILPSEEGSFLMGIVHFSSDSKEQPLFWIFRTEDEHEKDREKITVALGLPEKLFNDFQWKFTFVGEAKSLPLYLFSICLSFVITGNFSIHNLEEQISATWPEPKVISQMLLTKILLDYPSTSLQIAPPSEPLQFQYASLLEALQAYGVSVPSWFVGFAADKRQEFLQAIRDITNTVVFVIDMNKSNSSGEITSWKRKSTDKLVLLIAEKNGQFGGILRLKQSDDMHGATLSLLANRNSISKLQVNGSFIGHDEEYVLQFRPVVDTVIRCSVNERQFHLVCTSTALSIN